MAGRANNQSTLILALILCMFKIIKVVMLEIYLRGYSYSLVE